MKHRSLPRITPGAIAAPGLTALVLALAPSGSLLADETAAGGSQAAIAQPAGPAGGAAAEAAKGKELFQTWQCGSCHVLADAGAAGQAGPSLDGDPNLTPALIVNRVTYGQAAMPAFGGPLSEEDIADIAAYIMRAAAK